MAAELLRKQHLTLWYELPEDQPLNLRDSELGMWELPSWMRLSLSCVTTDLTYSKSHISGVNGLFFFFPAYQQKKELSKS